MDGSIKERIGAALRTYEVIGKGSVVPDVEWFVLPSVGIEEALWDAQSGSGTLDFDVARQQCDLLNAGAILIALRKPTEAMIKGAREAWDFGPGTSLDDTDATAERCWRTMIDVALKS